MKRVIPLLLLMVTAAMAEQSKPYEKYSGYKVEEKVTVAVSDFEGRGLAQGEALTLTDAFRSYILNTNVFRTLERNQMDEIMKEQGFQNSGACTDEACIVEMGQILGVDAIIAGSIGKVGGTYSVAVRMISVETGEISRTVSKFYKGEIDGVLTEILPQVAAELAGISKPAPKAVAVQEERESKKKEKRGGGKKGARIGVIVGVSALAVGGGAVAVLMTRAKDDAKNNEPGSVELTWD